MSEMNGINWRSSWAVWFLCPAQTTTPNQFISSLPNGKKWLILVCWRAWGPKRIEKWVKRIEQWSAAAQPAHPTTQLSLFAALPSADKEWSWMGCGAELVCFFLLFLCLCLWVRGCRCSQCSAIKRQAKEKEEKSESMKQRERKEQTNQLERLSLSERKEKANWFGLWLEPGAPRPSGSNSNSSTHQPNFFNYWRKLSWVKLIVALRWFHSIKSTHPSTSQISKDWWKLIDSISFIECMKYYNSTVVDQWIIKLP